MRNDVGVPGKEGLHVVHIRLISVLKVSFSYHCDKEDEDFHRDDQDIGGVSSHGGPEGNF